MVRRDEHDGKALALHVAICEVLNCVLALFSMAATACAMDYGINQGKQSLFIAQLKVNRPFTLRHIKYMVYKYSTY